MWIILLKDEDIFLLLVSHRRIKRAVTKVNRRLSVVCCVVVPGILIEGQLSIFQHTIYVHPGLAGKSQWDIKQICNAFLQISWFTSVISVSNNTHLNFRITNKNQWNLQSTCQALCFPKSNMPLTEINHLNQTCKWIFGKSFLLVLEAKIFNCPKTYRSNYTVALCHIRYVVWLTRTES